MGASSCAGCHSCRDSCGVVGGAFSAITHPIDCIITNSQKPSYSGKKDPLTVAKSIYKEAGWKEVAGDPDMAATMAVREKLCGPKAHRKYLHVEEKLCYDYGEQLVPRL